MKCDPYSKPAFGFWNKTARVAWSICYIFLFRLSPRPFFGWRRMLLRMFGARIGPGTAVYPSAKIWAPWNLVCEDMVAIANGADIYNPSMIHIGSHAIVSQDAFLCGASHDYDDPTFPLYSKPIEIGPYAWVCSRACVMPGVKVAEGSIVGLGSVLTKDSIPWGIYVGLPAKFLKMREMKKGYLGGKTDT